MTASNIEALTANRDAARAHYFALSDPGNLTPAQKAAFYIRSAALELLMQAAQIELDAETEMLALLEMEMVAPRD